MKVTPELAKSLELPEEFIGGFYKLYFEKVKDIPEDTSEVIRTFYGEVESAYDYFHSYNIGNSLTGRASAQLSMPDGRVFTASVSYNHLVETKPFTKKLSRTILAGRIAKLLKRSNEKNSVS